MKETELFKKISILIVEDDTNTIEELKEVLSLYFKFVYTAKDGCEGFELIKKYHPDIVLTDIQMPCMSGVEMLQEVKKTNLNSIFMFTTAYSDTNYLLNAIDIKVDAYLIKPLNISTLLEKIATALDEKNRVAPVSKNQLLHKKLSKREYEVFLDVAKGIKPINIAQKYDVKPKTISTYRNRILEKMGVTSNSDITRYAIANNLI